MFDEGCGWGGGGGGVVGWWPVRGKWKGGAKPDELVILRNQNQTLLT